MTSLLPFYWGAALCTTLSPLLLMVACYSEECEEDVGPSRLPIFGLALPPTLWLLRSFT